MSYIINNNVRLLVIGDLMLDHYIYGNCTRISPEAPVQVVEVKKEMYTLGGAGNVLKNLKSFNCEANIISVAGDDENARVIVDRLTETGTIDFHIINDNQRCTTIKSRVLVSNHQLIRLDREDLHPLSESIAKILVETVEKEVKNYDFVLLSDYNKGVFSPKVLSSIFSICKAAGVKTIVDPKGADFSKYHGANIIKPNKKEAIIATGISIIDSESIKLACAEIKRITGCDDVIITMSEEGIALYHHNELSVIPTKALDVIDVTGAGDTVMAALGLSIASKNSLYDSCDFANHAAAVVVSKIGTATATLAEIEKKFLL